MDAAPIGVSKMLAGGAAVAIPGLHEMGVWQTPSTQVMTIKRIDSGVTPRGSTNYLVILE